MSRKRTGAIPTTQPRKEKSMTIDMNELNLKNRGIVKPPFRTGGHMTEKDRPRKKNWIREEW